MKWSLRVKRISGAMDRTLGSHSLAAAEYLLCGATTKISWYSISLTLVLSLNVITGGYEVRILTFVITNLSNDLLRNSKKFVPYLQDGNIPTRLEFGSS